MDLEQALARIPGLSPKVRATPLEGGITNRNFRLDDGDRVLVLRLGGQNTNLLGIDRRLEHQAAHWAAAEGVGAPVVFSDPDTDVMVTTFISGRGLTPEEAREPKVLHELGALLRKVHSGPPLPGSFSPFATVRSYLDLARGPFPETLPEALNRMQAIEETLATDAKKPCHNDLLAGNFLYDGTAWRLLDWEYAGMGDPFFDLGNFAVNQELDEHGHRALLHGYFGEVRDGDLARLELMRLASDLREACWAFLQAGLSGLDFDYSAYGRRHLDRFLAGEHERHLERARA